MSRPYLTGFTAATRLVLLATLGGWLMVHGARDHVAERKLAAVERRAAVQATELNAREEQLDVCWAAVVRAVTAPCGTQAALRGRVR